MTGKDVKYQWKDWVTLLDLMRKRKPNMSADEGAAFLVEHTTRSGVSLNETDHAQWHGELVWEEYGRPYYKIYPDMLEAMFNTNVEIDQQYIQFPYPVFELKLPPGKLREEIGPCVLAQRIDVIKGVDAVWYDKGTIKELERSLGRRFVGNVRALYCNQNTCTDIIETVLGLFENTTIEESIELARRVGGCDGSISDEMLSPLFKTICATALFGIHRHELVLPDIKAPVIEVAPRGAKRQRVFTGKPPEHRGWTVGREIDLPRPEYTNNLSCSAGDRHLEKGHLRSGHLRMQACGKKWQDRKLIFVAPIRVRPDLPLSQHGYRIKQ